MFVFSTSETGGTDHHGVGFCYSRRIEKYSNHYIQHSSHLAEIEINMHGNPLVILSAYMPHDASNKIKLFTAWEDMSNIITCISHNSKCSIRRLQCSHTCKNNRGGRMSRTTHMTYGVKVWYSSEKRKDCFQKT